MQNIDSILGPFKNISSRFEFLAVGLVYTIFKGTCKLNRKSIDILLITGLYLNSTFELSIIIAIITD